MKFFQTVCFAALALTATCRSLSAGSAGPGDPTTRLLRGASLMLLKEGNARSVADKRQHPNLDASRRLSTAAQGQEPFATVLACSDSREPVELIFDRGIGDLFVVRVAGNIAGDSELASVEYGITHLNTPLLVVMGHTKCGAVTAVFRETEFHGHFHQIAERIKPAAAKAKAETGDTEEALNKAIQANVWQTIQDLIKNSSLVRGKITAGELYVVGAVHDLEQGTVNWLGPHPAQDSLVALAAQAETDPALVAQPSGAPVETNSVPANAEKPTSAVKNESHSPAKSRTVYQRGAAQSH